MAWKRLQILRFLLPIPHNHTFIINAEAFIILWVFLRMFWGLSYMNCKNSSSWSISTPSKSWFLFFVFLLFFLSINAQIPSTEVLRKLVLVKYSPVPYLKGSCWMFCLACHTRAWWLVYCPSYSDWHLWCTSLSIIFLYFFWSISSSLGRCIFPRTFSQWAKNIVSYLLCKTFLNLA